MQWVKHHGRRTAYRKRARTTGTPVVYVHGSGATHEAWASQFAIANERPVVALDLSGHGASDPVPTGCPPGSEMLAVYVEDVVAVYQAVEADAIVGVSLGGAVALGHPIGASGGILTTTLLYAMEHGDLDRGVVAMSVGGGGALAMSLVR